MTTAQLFTYIVFPAAAIIGIFLTAYFGYQKEVAASAEKKQAKESAEALQTEIAKVQSQAKENQRAVLTVIASADQAKAEYVRQKALLALDAPAATGAVNGLKFVSVEQRLEESLRELPNEMAAALDERKARLEMENRWIQTAQRGGRTTRGNLEAIAQNYSGNHSVGCSIQARRSRQYRWRAGGVADDGPNSDAQYPTRRRGRFVSSDV
jgi:hypothetical protein